MLRHIETVVQAQATSDGAGVKLLRSLGSDVLPLLDPFLLLDEFHSEDPGAYLAGFPPHPHKGFQTITYMLAGRMLHRDSLGNQGGLEAGDLQWMKAGNGIVHSEMPQQEDGLMWGYQLWVNLPAQEKHQAAQYRDVRAEEIPIYRDEAGDIAVIGGDWRGHRGPLSEHLELLYLDLSLVAGAERQIPVPQDWNAFLYPVEGEVYSDGQLLTPGQLGVLADGDGVEVRGGSSSARVLLLAAEPLGEPVARGGPFVMNTAEEIQQAFSDYQAGRMGGIPD